MLNHELSPLDSLVQSPIVLLNYFQLQLLLFLGLHPSSLRVVAALNLGVELLLLYQLSTVLLPLFAEVRVGLGLLLYLVLLFLVELVTVSGLT